jgi:hypothetical protein
VLNSSRGDALADPGYAQEADLEWVRATCTEAGLDVDLRQEVRGREASDELVDLLTELAADLCVIGSGDAAPSARCCWAATPTAS